MMFGSRLGLNEYTRFLLCGSVEWRLREGRLTELRYGCRLRLGGVGGVCHPGRLILGSYGI
jgi:hypothetical protein